MESHTLTSERAKGADPASGFMLTEVTATEIQSALSEDEKEIWVACDAAGEPVGFLSTSREVEEGVLQKVTWLDSRSRKVFESQRRIYVEKVVTKAAWRRKGVASIYRRPLSPSENM